tara:strand:- start:51 stop:551 length:501 start_codon:yes stop_codon:yes gene_type:complete
MKTFINIILSVAIWFIVSVLLLAFWVQSGGEITRMPIFYWAITFIIPYIIVYNKNKTKDKRPKNIFNDKKGSIKKEFKKKGIVKEYYKSGKLKQEANYKNDKLEGILKYYYESGQLEKELNYKNDKLEDISKYYYESGQIKSEIIFKNDINISEKEWDKDGKEKDC